MLSAAILEQYQLIQNGSCFASLLDRAWIELTGKDRQNFLHNLCTADIKALADGAATELFILDTRGKTLGFGHVLATEDRLLITMASKASAARICEHLDRYLIREDVQISDRSDAMKLYFVPSPTGLPDAGAESDKLESMLELEQALDSNSLSILASPIPMLIAKIELAGSGLLLAVENQHAEAITDWLSAQLSPCDDQALTVHRLEAGSPWLGAEIDDTNLPQELRRDAKAISFTKGCYLGQETVAKIDAFGHVNRFLVGMQLDCDEAELPERDSVILNEDKKAGILKSVAYSPKLEAWLGIGFIKCKLAEPDTVVTVGSTNAKIVKLPIE